MNNLLRFLPRMLIGVSTAYGTRDISLAVAAVRIQDNDNLALTFPKANPFTVGQEITVHLDDRVGSEIYTIELKVHRCSYKGVVIHSDARSIIVEKQHFELFYGREVVASHQADGFRLPNDQRPPRDLPISPLRQAVFPDDKEKENKIGVLVSRAASRPHTTVMAFLSSREDDIFLVTHPSTFKYQNLIRNGESAFAMDHRGSFLFEKAIDWNYTLLKTSAYLVPRETTLFSRVQALFIEKNPWEQVFFSNPETVLIHLAPQKIVYSDILEY